MNSYIITYRTPSGDLAECNVQARSHEAAQKSFDTTGGLTLVGIERVDDDYVEPKGKQMKTATISIGVGILLAVSVVAVFWWRRGCPGLELLK